MKKTIFCLAITLIISCCQLTGKRAVAQTFRDAGEYFGFMGNQFSNITNESWDYTSAVAHGKTARKVETRRKELVKAIYDAVRKIKKMPDYDGDAALRDSIVSFLNLDYNVMNYDYAKIVDMEDVAEQSYDLMEALLLAKELANNKLDDASDNLKAEQSRFAAEHNIRLVDSKDVKVEKLERSSYVFKYYNRVYLVFFKSYKQEMYLFDAMQNGDVSGIEQNKNSLIGCADEGLAKLDTMKNFKADASLKTACKAVLNFYKTEATSKLQDISDYFIAKENFEKIKKAFDAKSQTSRTQADIDQYNGGIGAINKASQKYNATNEELAAKRKTVLDNWNNAVDMFLDRHVPKNK